MYGRGYGGGIGFGPPVTPPVVKKLLIANGVVFLCQLLLARAGGLDPLTRYGAVVPAEFWRGMIWQPFTYMFLHSPVSLMHIGFNMLTLWMFGAPLAMVWGERRFLRFYLVCGVGAGLLIVPFLFFMSWAFGPRNVSHVGHLGGLLVAWVLLRRDRRERLLPGVASLRYRWRRFRMRRRLRSVQDEELRWRQRTRDDDRWLH